MTAKAGKIIVATMVMVGAGLIATAIYMSMKSQAGTPEPISTTSKQPDALSGGSTAKTTSNPIVKLTNQSPATKASSNHSVNTVAGPGRANGGKNENTSLDAEGAGETGFQSSEALKTALGVNDKDIENLQSANFESLLGSKRPAEGLYKTNAALYGVVPKKKTEDESPLAQLRAIATNGRYTIALDIGGLNDEQKTFLAEQCKPASAPEKASCAGDIVIRVYKEQYRTKHAFVGVE